MSGTTRDAVDTSITLPSGQKLTLIDTAGIRKRTKVAGSADGAEQLSVDRALRAVRRAEVVVQVLDASEGVTQQVRVAGGDGGRAGGCGGAGAGCVRGGHTPGEGG